MKRRYRVNHVSPHGKALFHTAEFYTWGGAVSYMHKMKVGEFSKKPHDVIIYRLRRGVTASIAYQGFWNGLYGMKNG